MVARGYADGAMARAAVDIRHAQMDDASAAAGLRAVDPGRLVVDGGRVAQSLHPAELRGGWVALGGAARSRWAAYAGDLRASGAMLRGRRATLYLDAVLVRVLVGGVRPRALDAELGVRDGRVGDTVLAELRRYAERYHLGA
ncbi:hypothetical protein [Azospirillum sp. ST 5-10]|uniref:hypothetical protein n=1 Tax=unclassified Azospirillum TaxID=2630922 RepID=UPI003F49ED0C